MFFLIEQFVELLGWERKGRQKQDVRARTHTETHT